MSDLSFDNIYINAQFKELDQQVSSVGGASVLPLTRREAQTYITPRQCKHRTINEKVQLSETQLK